MDIQLYALEMERPLGADGRERLREKRELSRCAYAVLRYAVRELFSWEDLPETARGEHGKPYFPAHPEVHFSLSHSGGAVLLAVHNEPIGADIERLRPLRTARLKAALGAATEEDFWRRWTAYESRCKRRGISAAAQRNLCLPEIIGERVLPLQVLPGYAACVCTASDCGAVKLNSLTADLIK